MFQRHALSDAVGERLVSTLTWRDALESWRHDRGFRTAFNTALADSPHAAFFWETPPLSTSRLDDTFELVLIDAPSLARVTPTPQPFAEHIGGESGVVAFDSLGGDAHLVVPCADGPAEHYAHLAAFVRAAPDEQADRLWQRTGEAASARVGAAPIWVSTSGLGVYWVHVRIDTRPKYYSYSPYRTP